jgi:hypothetical protein
MEVLLGKKLPMIALEDTRAGYSPYRPVSDNRTVLVVRFTAERWLERCI